MEWGRLAQQRPLEAACRLVVMTGLAFVAAIGSVTPALADDRPDGSEMATAGAMMVVIVIAFIAAGLGFWWSYKNGEYTEPEEIKYHMLAMVENEEDYWGMGTHDEEDEYVDDGQPLLGRPAIR